MQVFKGQPLHQFASQVLITRCEISFDLMRWGIDVEQRVGPQLWENNTGPVPSPLRWSFWQGVAMRHEIPVPDIDASILLYHEMLDAVATTGRLFDTSFERLYRVHHGAKLIYDEIMKEKL